MTTESLAQNQQTGEDQMSNIIDAAQLTHPISHAEDVDMPSNPATLRPDTHDIDIDTPRRRIGCRCRKWAVSTQTASQFNKRKCAACTMCGNQFTPGEQRLQQWTNRNTQRADVHAHGITGGIGRDHELVSKAATERSEGHRRPLPGQWTQAAAAVEVVLPVHEQMDDNSTEAPDDDDRLFDREEALRHDDAIMDLQWFNTIPWAEIEDLRGHGDSGLPCSRRSTPSYEPLCTTDLPPPTLNQHGRSFSSAVGSSWTGRRRTRRVPIAPASWRRVWNSSGLCSTVRAECDAAPTVQGRTRSRAEQTEARIRKVATLARAGEQGRALAAARNAPPVPVTRDTVQEITSLYATHPVPALALTNQISHIFPNRPSP